MTAPIQILDEEPDVDGLFSVFVDGYMERWSIDRIKDAVYNERRDLQLRIPS